MNAKKFIPKRIQSNAERRKAALKRLRERWMEDNDGQEWEPEKEPVVSGMFKAVEGGTAHVIEALRSHDDDDARVFLDHYDECSIADRKFIPIEAIAFASGVGSLRLAEVAQTALFLYGSMKTRMLISSTMAKVTQSIVKAATDEVPITAMGLDGEVRVVGHTNGDVRAMDLFGRMAGIVPVPKGAQIAIQNNFGDKEDKTEAAPAWRPAEDRLREFYDHTEPKRLPSPDSKPINIGGHIDQMQEETVGILRGE